MYIEPVEMKVRERFLFVVQNYFVYSGCVWTVCSATASEEDQSGDK